jgi:hypothetical protein
MEYPVKDWGEILPAASDMEKPSSQVNQMQYTFWEEETLVLYCRGVGKIW